MISTTLRLYAKKILFLIFLATFNFVSFGQPGTRGTLKLNVDLNNFKEIPFKAVVEIRDLGGYEVLTDTSKVSGKVFNYSAQIEEPVFTHLTFYWHSKKTTSISFWTLPLTYKLSSKADLNLEVTNNINVMVVNLIHHIENEIKNYRIRSDSLAKSVDYENKKVADVEERINHLRDSIDNIIDENIYKKTIIDHRNSPVGLYALCKYSERPIENERIKNQPKEIEILFDRLSDSVRQLPSAKILLNKLAISKKTIIGNKVSENISLSDTANKVFKISDFKGKYLFIDFWASWCIPCRAQNPMLKKVYIKYNSENFDIISVTRDRPTLKKSWLEAIRQDELNLWPQLNDFNNVAQKEFNIRFIPANYLIDPKGIIIARDLEIEQLDKKLKNIFNHN